ELPDRLEGSTWLSCAAADGSPEAKNLEIAPRQAPRPARHLRASAQPLPELPPADAAAPDVPDMQDVPRPRDRAAPPARLVKSWFASRSTLRHRLRCRPQDRRLCLRP